MLKNQIDSWTQVNAFKCAGDGEEVYLSGLVHRVQHVPVGPQTEQRVLHIMKLKLWATQIFLIDQLNLIE